VANLPLLTHPSSTGRDPQENLEALEEFKVFTQIKGLVAENLVILEQMGENICNPCPPLSPVTVTLMSPAPSMGSVVPAPGLGHGKIRAIDSCPGFILISGFSASYRKM
jgi:hypothetical protein